MDAVHPLPSRRDHRDRLRLCRHSALLRRFDVLFIIESGTPGGCISLGSPPTRPGRGPPKPPGTSSWPSAMITGSGSSSVTAPDSSQRRSTPSSPAPESPRSRTPPRSPQANAYAERWVRTLRHELLDRTIIWNERQLRRAARDYIAHYNSHRPHRGIYQRAPNDIADVVAIRPGHPIERHTVCRGLINEYRTAT